MNTSNIVRKVNPVYPAPKTITEAAKIMEKGGVIAFPTRCLYGLGADAFNAAAVKQLYELKQRPAQKPILILIEHRNYLKQLVRHVSQSAMRIMDHFWPGKITLVFEALSTVPEYLTAGTGKIGIRQPGHPVAAALVNAFQGPVTGTSANLSGSSGCQQITDLDPLLAQNLELILDAGLLKGGNGSTVVDVSGEVPRALREGVVSLQDIKAINSP